MAILLTHTHVEKRSKFWWGRKSVCVEKHIHVRHKWFYMPAWFLIKNASRKFRAVTGLWKDQIRIWSHERDQDHEKDIWHVWLKNHIGKNLWIAIGILIKSLYIYKKSLHKCKIYAITPLFMHELWGPNKALNLSHALPQLPICRLDPLGVHNSERRYVKKKSGFLPTLCRLVLRHSSKTRFSTRVNN